MRTLCIPHLRLQSKSYRRGFAIYKARPRQFEEDRKYPIRSCRLQTTSKDEGWESTTLTSQSTLDNRDTGLLAGKNAIITGASRGIGAAIAERFANEGARCVLVGRNVGALTHVKEGLIGSHKTDHAVKVGDVRNLEFWKEVARSERNVDILVNAAGITHYTALFTTQPDILEEVVHTNLMGTMLSCRSIGRLMMGKKSTDRGCIINISSLLGLKDGRGSVGYAASKAGVIGLTRALASEIGRAGIRVNVIVPGYVKSEMTAAMTPEGRSKAIESIPLGRFGEVSEVADAALFLATNMYANNCVLNLDGGLSAT